MSTLYGREGGRGAMPAPGLRIGTLSLPEGGAGRPPRRAAAAASFRSRNLCSCPVQVGINHNVSRTSSAPRRQGSRPARGPRALSLSLSLSNPLVSSCFAEGWWWWCVWGGVGERCASGLYGAGERCTSSLYGAGERCATVLYGRGPGGTWRCQCPPRASQRCPWPCACSGTPSGKPARRTKRVARSGRV